jgi:hypothetical protein
MSSFKKLSKSDVSVVPYYANKQWSIPSSSISSYATVFTGNNVAGVFSPATDPTSKGQYQRLIYSQINQLFYQAYSGSLNTSSLANSIYYESASQQRPTSSYFIYNDNSNLVTNFPTGSGDQIIVLSVDQNTYGNKILPRHFQLSSSANFIIDDGYGNLIDITSVASTYITNGYFDIDAYFEDSSPGVSTYIGNIYYAQGLVVVTNPLFLSIFNESTLVLSYKNEHIIYENEVRCLVKESDYNLSYNPTLVTNYASGSVKDFATGSNFYTYATALGLYNDNNELLAVAKFGKPMLMSPDTDMTFVIKYDT